MMLSKRAAVHGHRGPTINNMQYHKCWHLKYQSYMLLYGVNFKHCIILEAASI